MSREYQTRYVDVQDLDIDGDTIECGDPGCDGAFGDFEIIHQYAEAIELEADCTHCSTKLYLCHEVPSSVAYQVPQTRTEPHA
jgi:hypothetical protein